MFKIFKDKIINSFKKCNEGKENFDIVIYYWGIAAYFVNFFILEALIIKNGIYIINFILSLLISLYFAWHIFAINRCKPKKESLSNVKKIVTKQQLRSKRLKNIFDKIFLRKSITNFNPPFIMTIVDLYIIASYLSRLYR